MKSMIKFELNRFLKSKLFYVSLVICVALSVWMTIISVQGLHLQMALIKASPLDDIAYYYPLSLYNSFIGIDYAKLPSAILFTIFPLLTCISYAYTYVEDRESGYIQNIVTRSKKSYYFISKYLITLLSAFTIVIFAFAFNFLTTSLFVPALLPETASFTFPTADSFNQWSRLYQNTPALYILIYSLLDAAYLSVFTTLALPISMLIKNKYVIMISPFIVYLLFDYLMGLIGKIPCRPTIFLRQYQPVPFEPIVMIVQIISFLLISGIAFLIFEGKKDVL